MVAPREFFTPKGLAEAKALQEEYTAILDRIFNGVVVLDAPFNDPKFWQLFQARVTHLRSMEADAVRWSGVKELAREIGKAMKP